MAISLLLCSTIHAMTPIPDAEATPTHILWSMKRKAKWIGGICAMACIAIVPEAMELAGTTNLKNYMDYTSCHLIDNQDSMNLYNDNSQCLYTINPVTNISSTIQEICNVTSIKNASSPFILLKECEHESNRAYREACLLTFYGSLLPTFALNFGCAAKAIQHIYRK